MTESVYKVIELVGTSTESWEYAARNAIEAAGQSLRELRIAEVGKLDMKVENGKVTAYRARVKLSFKYRSESDPETSRTSGEHSPDVLSAIIRTCLTCLATAFGLRCASRMQSAELSVKPSSKEVVGWL